MMIAFAATATPEHELPGVICERVRGDVVQLQADDQEQHRVRDEDERVPEAGDLPAACGRHDARCHAAGVHAGGHHGQHARQLEILRREVGEKRQHQRDRALQLRVLDAAPHRNGEPAGDESECDRTESDDHEVHRSIRHRELARRDGRQRRRVDHERGGVVEQAFAVDDRDDVARQSKALQHGDRRQLVGRRDDGAENERRGPRHAWDDRVREDRDRGRRHEDEPERERRDLTAVLPHDVGGRGDRFPIQQRREKDQQHEVGVELDLRQPRYEPEHEPAGNQRDGIRNIEALRQRDERDGNRQQRDEKPGLEINHRASL